MSLHAVQVKGRFYILKDIIKNGKHSTTTVEKLGTAEDIIAAHGCDDPKKWAKERALELDMKEREQNDPEGRHYVLARDNVRIPKGERNSYNVGYLPLQKIYYDLRFPSICRSVAKQHGFDFDLDAIFQDSSTARSFSRVQNSGSPTCQKNYSSIRILNTTRCCAPSP